MRQFMVRHTVTPQGADAQTPQGDKTTAHAGRSWRAWFLFAAVAGAALVMDLTLKAYAFEVVAGQPVKWSSTEPGHAMIPDHDGVTLIPKVLALQLTTNRGAVFGLGQGGRWIFVGISVVAVIFIVSLFWRSRARAYGWHAAMGLIFAGAISNLYDRWVYASVRDMLHFFPGVQLPFGLRWPGGSGDLYPWISNLADVWLVVGVGTILLVTGGQTFRRNMQNRSSPSMPGLSKS